MLAQQTRQTEAVAAVTTPSDILGFVELVRGTYHDVTVDLDAPGTETGEWWIDVSADGFRTTLLWTMDHGFGVFTSEPGYGDRPDECYRNHERLFRRFSQLVESHTRDTGMHPLHLRDVRALVGTQQAVVADRMRVNQAAVSKLESRRDMKLSTVTSYVEALGGRVELRAVFDDFAVNMALPEEAESA